MNDYLLLALIELGALAVFVSVTVAAFLYLRRRELDAAAQAAAKKLRDGEEDRLRSLTAILSGVHRLPESVSAGLSIQLMRCERTLLRQCFDILLSPDPASAARLGDTLFAGLDDYLRKCAAPNMPRTDPPLLEEGEKLPYWMNKLEKGEVPKEGEIPPETQTTSEAFWPARGGWIEEEQEAALPEDALPAAEKESGALPVVEPVVPPEKLGETEPAVALEETVSPSGAAELTEEIGGLLDAYEQEHAPASVVAASESEPPPEQTARESSASDAVEFAEPLPIGPLPRQGNAEGKGAMVEREPPDRPDALSPGVEAGEPDAPILPPSSPAVTVEALMAEFGLAPPQPDEAVSLPEEESAAPPLAIAPQETAASSSQAPADDVDALLAELGFHAETPPAVPEQKPIAAPVKKPVSSYVEGSVAPAAEAPQANASAVDALLAEFGFHDEAEMKSPKPAQAKTAVSEPARESPDTAHADPAAVEALLAEFGFVPDLGEGAESDTASPAPAPRGTGKRKIVDETQENSETTANKRRGGRKKAESP